MNEVETVYLQSFVGNVVKETNLSAAHQSIDPKLGTPLGLAADRPPSHHAKTSTATSVS